MKSLICLMMVLSLSETSFADFSFLQKIDDGSGESCRFLKYEDSFTPSGGGRFAYVLYGGIIAGYRVRMVRLCGAEAVSPKAVASAINDYESKHPGAQGVPIVIKGSEGQGAGTATVLGEGS